MEKKINLPNKLTILRIILVPVFMFFIVVPIFGEHDTWARIIAASLFLAATITDFLDGVIARRANLVTDFGKLMDPLADKFMVMGALIAITAAYDSMRMMSVWVTTIVFFRELAVTSLRLVANTEGGEVIAAKWIGKVKTFTQCVCILTVLLEPIVLTNTLHTPQNLFSYITMSLMTLITLYSGYVYFKSYWKYINPMK